MKLKYRIDYKRLESYLKSLNKDDIETMYRNPNNPKLIMAETMDDIEFFNLDKSKISLDKVVNYGEPFLVDILGNDLSVVILSRRKYKTPNNRLVRAKYITTIIDDCTEVFGTPLNGYWIIPKQYITKI